MRDYKKAIEELQRNSPQIWKGIGARGRYEMEQKARAQYYKDLAFGVVAGLSIVAMFILILIAY